MLVIALFFVIGFVKTGTFENESGSDSEEALGLAFAAGGAGFDGSVIHGLKHLPFVPAGLALIIVGWHRFALSKKKKANLTDQRANCKAVE